MNHGIESCNPSASEIFGVHPKIVFALVISATAIRVSSPERHVADCCHTAGAGKYVPGMRLRQVKKTLRIQPHRLPRARRGETDTALDHRPTRALQGLRKDEHSDLAGDFVGP